MKGQNQLYQEYNMDKYLKFNYYKSLSLQVIEEAYDKTKK